MIGNTISHYKIIEKLGEGGMGIVYLAEDTKLKRQVAIKFLPKHIATNSDERQRFQIEAQAAAALNHPNITTIYNIEEADGELFIVMEYIEGQELKNLIHPPVSPLDKGELRGVIDIAIQISEGLNAAHEKGIVHRDIKSTNIMVTKDGKVKIMDFGLAKLGHGIQLTKEQSTLGTAPYMSPEQISGDAVDQRSDIWSFGVVLYELLTGQLPFRGDYEQAVMYSIVHEDFSPVPESNPEVPNFLQNIVKKCLQKSINERYQSLRKVLNDLKIQSDISDPGTKILPEIKINDPTSQRRKVLFSIAGITLIAILITILLGGISTFNSWFSFIQVPKEQHLMVLPITNIGGDQNDQAFCDGLVETLTSKLSQLEKYHGSLWVVPSSEAVRNIINSPSEAHQMFDVNLAVSGSLQLINDIYRLTINLIDAENLRQLNSTIIDMNKSNVTNLQDQSVLKLVNMLNLQLNPETEQVLQSGGSTVPGSYEFYLQARGYLQRYENETNLNLAIDLFKSAIARDSSFALARAGLAEAYWRTYEILKDPIWAYKAHLEGKHAFELNSNLAAVNITLGMIHAGTGQYEDAVNSFTLALNEEPTNSDAYRGLAKAYEAQNLLNEAETTYKKAISLKPDYWAGYNSLGAFYYKHARYDEAISQFIQVIKLTPDNKKGYNNLGGVYYALERWKEAREMFEKSLALKKSYGVSSNLGTLYFIEGDYKNAAKMYQLALNMNDHDYRIWGNLASACQWIPGKHEQAIKNYKIAIDKALESIEINPNDVGTIASLAGYYATIGESKKAKLYVEKSLKMAPNELDVIYQAGTTFEQLGEREKALHWLGKAIEGGYSYSEIANQPELKNLLADDRFNQMLKMEINSQKK